MYTGYRFSDNHIYGPRGYTGYWLLDNHVYSRSGYTGFHISDDQFYGSGGYSGYYVSDGYIYGPEARLPWLLDSGVVAPLSTTDPPSPRPPRRRPRLRSSQGSVAGSRDRLPAVGAGADAANIPKMISTS